MPIGFSCQLCRSAFLLSRFYGYILHDIRHKCNMQNIQTLGTNKYMKLCNIY
nr:MAG TPA: hypothetical protein [Caudoviricetes sp.]